jgi:hypothetical protein
MSGVTERERVNSESGRLVQAEKNRKCRFRQWQATARIPLLGAAALFAAVGCGGRPSSATTPQPVPTPEQAPTSRGVKPTVEVQPAPEGLFLVGRVAKVDQFVSQIGSWCNLPFGINDGLSMLGNDLPNLINLDLPVDFAMALAPEEDANASVQTYASEVPDWQDGGVVEEYREPPDVYGIVSVAVTNPEGLLLAFKDAGKSIRTEDGEFYIEVEPDLNCKLSASSGPTAQRLACGVTPEDVTVSALADYANTALVDEKTPDKAAYMELRVAPLRERYGNDVRQMRAELPEFLKEVTIGNERFDRAMAEAAPALVEEIIAWVDGVETWNFSLDFTEEREVLLGESTVRFRKGDSYAADVLQRGAGEAAPAPQLFWDLPRDVDAASFSGKIAATPGDKKIANNISELLAGALEHGGVASGTLDNWVTSLRALMESRGTVVMGAGSLPVVKGADSPTRSGAQSANKSRAGKQSKADAADVFNALGYYLIGVEGDQGAYARIWRSSVATFNDKRLRSHLAKTFEEDMPKIPLIRIRKLTAQKALPAIEVFDVSYKMPKEASESLYKVDKVGFFVAMATVGERTWFGLGFTEAAALDPLRLVTGGEDYPKLGARDGLSSLREHRILHGSFSSMNSYAKLFAGLPFGPGEAPFGASLLRAMPHHGTTPSVFEILTSADGPSLTARAELPREVFEDGSAFTVALVAAFSSAFRGGNGLFGLD